MLEPILAPGLSVVIAGTVGRRFRPAEYYAGPGNRFWELLHGAGLAPLLDPASAASLPAHGVGLTDLVLERVQEPGREPETRIDLAGFDASLRTVAPRAVAFVSKTAATWYARGAGERLPRDYGPLPWRVAGRIPAFVLPGPSGANNGMPVPVRQALGSDLADFLDDLGR